MASNLMVAERALRELDSKWLALMEHSPNKITFLNLEGFILFTNMKGADVTQEGAAGRSFLDLLPQEQRNQFEIAMLEVCSSDIAASRFRTAEPGEGRSTSWWSYEVSGIKDSGSILGFLIIGTDISSLVDSEEELRQKNRALSVLSQCNQAIVRNSEKQGLLKRVCDIIVDVGDYSLAWVGFAKRGDEASIRIAAQSGAEGGLLIKPPAHPENNWILKSPAGISLRTHRPSVTRSLNEMAELSELDFEALPFEFNSMIGLPLMDEDQAFGTLCIHSRDHGAFDEEEIQLLEELAGNLAFAITALRTRLRSKMAEEALEVSESRYREMFENNPHPMWVYDMETLAFLDVNNAAIAHYGYTRDELQTMTIEDIRPVEDLPDLMKKVSRAAPAMDSPGIRRHIKKSGQVINVDVTTHTLTYGGRPAKLVLANDVTERLAMEKALKDSEEQFRIAFRTSPDAININRMSDGLYIDINEGFTATTGFERDETIGKTSLELNIWKKKEDRVKLVEELDRDGEAHNLEAEFIVKDGSVKTGLMSAKAVSLGGEKCILSVTRDVTNIKRAELAVRESEAKYRELFEESPDGIFICTPQGRILDINTAGKNFFGNISLEDLLQIDIMSMILSDTDNRKSFESSLSEKGYVKDLEVVIERADGSRVIALYSATAVKDDQGTITALRSSMRDITERRRLRDHLFQAQKLETIGTLAGGIAHDFNNILTPIFGHISMALCKLPEDSDARENLDQVITASERAKELVKQILTFSKVTDQEYCSVDTYLVVKEALKLIRASLPTNIEIKADLDDKCGTVFANPTQIHQMVMNLCTNAHHAMKPNGGILKVTLDTIDAGKAPAFSLGKPNSADHVRLTVSDTGVGMDLETRNRVFEPFFTTKQTHEGTGLGLSMVHGIVGGVQGTITVDSKPGEGSTFTVCIPRVEMEAEEVDRQTEGSYTGSEHVLFVDDEREIAQTGKDFLELMGYTVTVKTDSLEALETFRSDPDWFDVIVTDQMMPHMTGLEFARKLKEIKPDIPIIITTGYSEEITEESIQSNGIDAFLMKPYMGYSLGRAIRSVVDPTSGEEKAI